MLGIIFYFKGYKDQGWIRTPITFKRLNDKWCETQISGEPTEAKDSYVKLHLHCINGQVSINTFDIRALKTQNLKEMVKLLSDMYGLNENDFFKKFTCVGDKSYNYILVKNETVECFENQ